MIFYKLKSSVEPPIIKSGLVYQIGALKMSEKTAARFRWQGHITDEMVSAYQRDGFLILDGFASADECAAMMTQTASLIDGFDEEAQRVIFSASGQSHAASDYFMNSASNISFFLEAGAVDEDGRLTKPKSQAVNKIGHALHDLDPVFSAFSHQAKMADLASAIGFKDPKLLQSMVICKQPHIGGEVNAHQDSTFLYTEPESCVGFWLALEEATLENGCMWAAPKAQNGPLHARFIRGDDGMEMKQINDSDQAVCEVPLPAPAGTLILLHGRLPHLSPANSSSASRYAYALHVIDGTADYSQDNWLQRDESMPLRGFQLG